MSQGQIATGNGSVRTVPTYFGDFEVGEADVLEFPTGLPGFEQSRRFVLLSSQLIDPLQCLQAVEGESASFFVIDPRSVYPGYRTQLSATDRSRLEWDERSPLLWLAMVVIDDAERAWVNLRAPIVINPTRMRGLQVLQLDAGYPLRHPIG